MEIVSITSVKSRCRYLADSTGACTVSAVVSGDDDVASVCMEACRLLSTRGVVNCDTICVSLALSSPRVPEIEAV